MPDITESIAAEHLRIGWLSAELDRLLGGADLAGPGTAPSLVWDRLAQFLEFHLDAAEEIGERMLAMADHGTGLDLQQARDNNADIREAVAESRLSPPGSRPWRMAVQAAQAAVLSHIRAVESGPLTRFRLHAAPSVRATLADQWVAYMAARNLDASRRADLNDPAPARTRPAPRDPPQCP